LDLKPFRITACSRRPNGMSTDGSEPMPRHPQHHPWGKLPDSRRRQASQQEPGETSELMSICPHRARLAHLRITCADIIEHHAYKVFPRRSGSCGWNVDLRSQAR
jgi:hypothetical protein